MPPSDVSDVPARDLARDLVLGMQSLDVHAGDAMQSLSVTGGPHGASSPDRGSPRDERTSDGETDQSAGTREDDVAAKLAALQERHSRR